MDVLRDIMRLLVAFMGGSPEAVPATGDPNDAIRFVVDYFAIHGSPSGLTSDEAAAGRSLVRDACEALRKASGDIDPLVAAAFEAMLRTMYADLGGDPGDLP